MGRKRNLGMHQEALKLPSPAIAFRELAKVWLRKAFAAGNAVRRYKEAGTESIDAAFMDASNEGINHVYGFEGYVPPTRAFEQYVEGYVYCCMMNKMHSKNAPFDSVQPIRESADWRKRNVPKAKTQSALDDGLDERDSKILAALVDELSTAKRERTEDDRIADIDFVVAEIESRLMLCMNQLDRDRGFATESVVIGEADPAHLDSLLSQDQQEDILGECCRRGDTVIREGMRGAYATAVANLKRAMFSPEQERMLSGVYWETRESWVYLQRIHRTNVPNPKPKSKEDKS